MKRTEKITDICRRVKNSGKIGVYQGKFYKINKTEIGCEQISKRNLTLFIRGLYEPEERIAISTSAIKEAIARIEEEPDMQLEFYDYKCQDYVNLENGVFNIKTGKLETVPKDRLFSYILRFKYIPVEKRNTPVFNKFLELSFPYDTEIKRKALEEILGYVISDSMSAKAGFFFIGESNSGKSTILELLRKIFQENQITAINLEELGNRFKLGKLSEARINISSEMSDKSFQAANIFKMVTSNEIVTGEHKGEKPFEFRIKCKLINAGNMIPKMGSTEGIVAILNRMVILFFPTSIPKEQQDIDLLKKLEKEKDAIFSEALDALYELQTRDFKFTVPEDSRRIKEQIEFESRAVEMFIEEKCVLDAKAKIYKKLLYEAFVKYCEENLIEVSMTSRQFHQKILRNQSVYTNKIRMGSKGPSLWGLVGIGLKIYEEPFSEDSNDPDKGENTDALNMDHDTEENDSGDIEGDNIPA